MADDATMDFSEWKMWWITCLIWILTVLQDSMRIGSTHKWWFVGLVTLYFMMNPWKRSMPWSLTFGISFILIMFGRCHYSLDHQTTPFHILYYGVILMSCLMIFYARHYIPVGAHGFRGGRRPRHGRSHSA